MSSHHAVQLWDTVRLWLRGVTPLAVTLLLLFITHMPGTFPSLAAVMPPLALMSVFYWAVHRPDWFGAISAFITGLGADLLFGAPLGISAGLYAASHILLAQQQRFFKGTHFPMVWAGYALTQFVVTLGQLLLWWLVLGRTPVLGAFLTLNIIGVLLFPPVCWGLSRLHKALTVE